MKQFAKCPQGNKLRKKRGNSLLAVRKRKSELLKKQAVERMVLKERLRELSEKKKRLRRGENVKAERRELGKYIRQLREQCAKKHALELQEVEEEAEACKNRHSKSSHALVGPLNQSPYKHMRTKHQAGFQDWEDVSSDDEEVEEVKKEDMLQMFANLTL